MTSRNTTSNMGAGTEAHITGSDETGTFITDEPPTSATPSNGSSNLGINTTGANRANFTPDSPAEGQPPTGDPANTQAPPLTRVSVGMAVVDAAGEQAGHVSAVQLPGTETRPDAPAGLAEEMMDTGYIRVDGAGHLANDTYARGDQIADTDADSVMLRVGREELIRAI